MSITMVRKPPGETRDLACRDRDAMATTFEIAPRRKGCLPRPEDAVRVRAMRRVARARLNYCGLADLADDVQVLVSELVTNAIRHSAGTTITLSMRLQDDILRVSVGHNAPARDDVPARPVLRVTSDEDETGRGLHLVSALAEEHHGSWGVSPDGTTTWCTFALVRGA